VHGGHACDGGCARQARYKLLHLNVLLLNQETAGGQGKGFDISQHRQATVIGQGTARKTNSKITPAITAHVLQLFAKGHDQKT